MWWGEPDCLWFFRAISIPMVVTRDCPRFFRVPQISYQTAAKLLGLLQPYESVPGPEHLIRQMDR